MVALAKNMFSTHLKEDNRRQLQLPREAAQTKHVTKVEKVINYFDSLP